MRLCAAAMFVVSCASLLWGVEGEYDAPAYPTPQIWKKASGSLDVKGCSIFMPGGSGTKVRVVAEALGGRLGIICKTDLRVREKSLAPDGMLMLCVSRSAPDWKVLTKTIDFAAIPKIDVDRGYVLRITPEHALIGSQSARGLSYGAVTMMDVARRAGGKPLPAVEITDWPDMPVRGFYGTHVFNRSTVELKDIKTTASFTPLVKNGILLLELDTGAFRLNRHPELHRTGSWNKKEYTEMVRLPLAEGVEVIPWVQMGKSISLRFGVPYAPLDDDDPTYVWGFETVADEMLEVFLPRNFCVGMNEDWHFLFGPLLRRDKRKWRDTFVRFAEYLRRRGVSPWVLGDYLIGPNGMGYGGAWGKETVAHGLRLSHRSAEFYAPLMAREGLTNDDHGHGSVMTSPRTGYPSKPDDSMSDKEFNKRFEALMDEYRKYAGSFPKDTVFFPKHSDAPHTIALGNMTGAGCRVVAFSPYVCAVRPKRFRTGNGRMFPAAIRYLRREEQEPAAQGCISGLFGGGWFSMNSGVRSTQNLMGAGPQWNVGSIKSMDEDCMKYFVRPSPEENAISLGWRSLMDADPEGTLPQAIERVKDPTWRWVEAREDAVTRGLPAVAALLAAMKSNGGELRQRFEGCVSRIARDARNGIDRGALDIKAVERYVSEPKSDVANIAAEAIGAAGPGGMKRLAVGLSNPEEAAACAWALGYSGDTDAGGQLCSVLTSARFSSEAKANAARSAGRLGVKEAAGPLAALIRAEKNPAAQRVAAWALALLGALDHDETIATLLHSPDKETRCRAVMALAVLRSPELLKTGHILASDDRNEAWIATWALFPGHVFDRFIACDRIWAGKPKKKDPHPTPRYERSKTLHRVQLDMLDIEKKVSRDEALKLLAKAAPKQKDELLKALMERIPAEQDGFEYQNRPWPPRKGK